MSVCERTRERTANLGLYLRSIGSKESIERVYARGAPLGLAGGRANCKRKCGENGEKRGQKRSIPNIASPSSTHVPYPIAEASAMWLLPRTCNVTVFWNVIAQNHYFEMHRYKTGGLMSLISTARSINPLDANPQPFRYVIPSILGANIACEGCTDHKTFEESF